jgi:hypothetical protein
VIDERAAGCVDEGRAVAEQREPAGIDHVPRGGQRGRVEADDVRRGEQLFQLA